MTAAFRQHALPPQDNCLHAPQVSILHLMRSVLHRCFQRDGISRLPHIEGDKVVKKASKPYPIEFFHIDIAGPYPLRSRML